MLEENRQKNIYEESQTKKLKPISVNQSVGC